MECGGVLSSTKSIVSGVPQGSILEPLLFLIYVNDFPSCLNCGQALMFADDTTVLFSSRSYDSLLNMANSNLDNVQEWLIANKLSLNVAKTKYIVFHTPHSREPPSDASLRIRNKAITKSTSVKFPAIGIQEHLCWKEHMGCIIQKVRACIAAVRRVKNYLDINALLLLYHTLVMSHISYCISAWCYGNKTMVNTIQRQANQFIRIIFGLKKKTIV